MPSSEWPGVVNNRRVLFPTRMVNVPWLKVICGGLMEICLYNGLSCRAISKAEGVFLISNSLHLSCPIMVAPGKKQFPQQ